MLVDDVGDVTITNDGATILSQLDVEHPAAKVLVDLAKLQDDEVGDGTTSVVVLAAELLKRANELTNQKIHPTSIIAGYRMAVKEACKYVRKVLAVDSASLGPNTIENCARTAMSSKIIGTDMDYFAPLITNALTRVKVINKRGNARYPIKAVNVLRCQGKSMRDSQFIEGYALNSVAASRAMPKFIKNAKIACLDFNLNKHRMSHGVSVVVTNPDDIAGIRQRETDITKERIKMMLDAGANVILTSKGIDDLCTKYFVEAGAIAVRRVDKQDLRQIAKATGATVSLSLTNLEGEEEFSPSLLGEAEEVSQEVLSDRELLIIKGCKTTRTSSLILRGPNEFTLDEMDRAVHDVICIVKRTLESKSVVPGGGAVEAALSIYLENFANTLGTREQLAIAQFAEALLVIPKTLAVNAACDAIDLVAQLRAHHNAAQTSEAKKHLSASGLNLKTGEVRNNLEAGVLEPAVSKIKSLQFATEAAITILRIDDLITLAPERPPERH
eukprot:TRINITY_DN4821_c0_g1_i1.p1 TRINITY_DN4821_c0_g1~~TRINITY_DN4821_c0_g1_i1.p1  ORF type:complete len:555 (-),score=187.63 TRINITY_DN4821_c0_g1_i1:143-1642(-)